MEGDKVFPAGLRAVYGFVVRASIVGRVKPARPLRVAGIAIAVTG